MDLFPCLTYSDADAKSFEKILSRIEQEGIMIHCSDIEHRKFSQLLLTIAAPIDSALPSLLRWELQGCN